MFKKRTVWQFFVDVEANWICKRSLFDCYFSSTYKVSVSTLSGLDKLLASAGCVLLTTARDIPSTLPKVVLLRSRSEWRWQPGWNRSTSADRAAELSLLSSGEKTEGKTKRREVSGVAQSAALGLLQEQLQETQGCFSDIRHRKRREGGRAVLAKRRTANRRGKEGQVLTKWFLRSFAPKRRNRCWGEFSLASFSGLAWWNQGGRFCVCKVMDDELAQMQMFSFVGCFFCDHYETVLFSFGSFNYFTEHIGCSSQHQIK